MQLEYYVFSIDFYWTQDPTGSLYSAEQIFFFMLVCDINLVLSKINNFYLQRIWPRKSGQETSAEI